MEYWTSVAQPRARVRQVNAAGLDERRFHSVSIELRVSVGSKAIDGFGGGKSVSVGFFKALELRLLGGEARRAAL